MSDGPKPILAITLGDPAGSGPELITKALVDAEVRAVCRPVVVGDAATLRAAMAITRIPAAIRVVDRAKAVSDDRTTIDVIDLANVVPERLRRGEVSADL